ncbi:hypothetical protein ACN9MB_17470 [Dyella kyungheensis]|uniref:hypothetical protein n=1 Tax=Dyella kyungheensis TaxID=1242174 RepID=UPI003CED984E
MTIRKAPCISVLLRAVIALTFAWHSPLHASQIDEYAEMTRRFDDWVANHNAPPTIEDRTGRQLIDHLSDNRQFIEAPSYTSQNLAQLIAVCNFAAHIDKSYIYASEGLEIDHSASSTDFVLAQARLEQKNSLVYQSELQRIRPFAARCLSRAFPLLSDALAREQSPEDVSATHVFLAQSRKLASSLLGAAVAAAGENQFSFEYRTVVLHAVSRDAVPLVSILTLDQRRIFSPLIIYERHRTPDALKGDLEVISDAFKSGTCEAACSN